MTSRFSNDAAERLTSLKELHDQGLITDSEYAEKRQSIIDGLVTTAPLASDAELWGANAPIRPKPGVSFKKVMVVGAAVFAVILLFNSLSNNADSSSSSADATSSAQSAENPVVKRINASESCAVLQAEFDQAVKNHEINTERQNLDLMKLATSYMKAADNRMEAIGCYD